MPNPPKSRLLPNTTAMVSPTLNSSPFAGATTFTLSVVQSKLALSFEEAGLEESEDSGTEDEEESSPQATKASIALNINA